MMVIDRGVGDQCVGRGRTARRAMNFKMGTWARERSKGLTPDVSVVVGDVRVMMKALQLLPGLESTGRLVGALRVGAGWEDWGSDFESG